MVTEIKKMRHAARFGRYAVTWPSSALQYMAFSPFQNIAIQALKDEANATSKQEHQRARDARKRLNVAIQCSNPESYVDILLEIEKLVQRADDLWRWFVFNEYLRDAREKGESIADDKMELPRDVNDRLKALWRRGSLSNASEDELLEKLERHEASLRLIVLCLQRVTKSWRGAVESASSDQQERDRIRFSKKLTQLYGHEGDSADG